MLLLCAGLWTPLAGAALSVFAFWFAFSGSGYARAGGLVDRCPPVRKKTPDSGAVGATITSGSEHESHA